MDLTTMEELRGILATLTILALLKWEEKVIINTKPAETIASCFTGRTEWPNLASNGIVVPNFKSRGTTMWHHPSQFFFAAVWTILLLQTDTRGTRLFVVKDYQALKWILLLKQRSETLAKWLLRFIKLQIDVIYQARIINERAYALLPQPTWNRRWKYTDNDVPI